MSLNAVALADSTSCTNSTGLIHYEYNTYEGGAVPTPDMLKNFNRDRVWVSGTEVSGKITSQFSQTQVLNVSNGTFYQVTTYSTFATLLFADGTRPSIETYFICDHAVYVGPPKP